MKILICGGSGFIGEHLTQYLLEQGHKVVILDRNRAKITSPLLQFFKVDLLRPEFFKEDWFEGVDAVVNLSGKNIFTLWTKKNKREIWDSRVKVNRNLIDFISGLSRRPRVFVSASAVGYYGNKGETEIDESASRGQGFLAELCEAWEEEAKRAEKLGLRSVQIRTAPVLDKSGGILRQILKSFRFGFTFIFGSGSQWFSWIHMNDLVRIYYLAVTDKNLSGPVNSSSPNPVRFGDFINHLRKFRRAIVIPFPSLILKLILKDTADVILFSQRMIPARLLKMNLRFSYPSLNNALKEIFSQS
ncbi:MAG: TIGR01777 family oxidoreductase [Nitrospirota bacterium]